MKHLILLLPILVSCNILLAQDVIVKKNGDEIESKILEITTETIKYKEFTFQEGPIRNIKISDVFMIIYENGKREVFTLVDEESRDGDPEVYNGNHYLVGAGYGNSYGGSGFRLQWRTGGTLGFGVHVGFGCIYNESEGLIPFTVLVSTGVKFFPYKSLYLNAQFGLTGFEYSNYYDPLLGIWEGRYNKLYGPSFLFGGDWSWGEKIGYGFNAGIGLTHNLNASHYRYGGIADFGIGQDVNSFELAIDMGFQIRF
jgi:hypothetical protein